VASPVTAQYGSTNQPPPSVPNHPGTLPLTGFDLAILLVVAFVLSVAGLILRRFRAL
jgi:hypothetical protein